MNEFSIQNSLQKKGTEDHPVFLGLQYAERILDENLRTSAVKIIDILSETDRELKLPPEKLSEINRLLLPLKRHLARNPRTTDELEAYISFVDTFLTTLTTTDLGTKK